MLNFYVLLDTVEKVKYFVKTSSKYPFDIDLSSGRYIVDGKSIMGIFSFDLSCPINVSVYTDDADAFMKEIEDLLIDEQ